MVYSVEKDEHIDAQDDNVRISVICSLSAGGKRKFVRHIGNS